MNDNQEIFVYDHNPHPGNPGAGAICSPPYGEMIAVGHRRFGDRFCAVTHWDGVDGLRYQRTSIVRADGTVDLIDERTITPPAR